MQRKKNRVKNVQKKAIRKAGKPFVPIVQYFFTATVLVAIVIMFPLSLVWKQVYITDTSMHRHALKDSLTTLHKEVTALTIMAERLSSTARIERIAKESLSLDYPSSKEIIVVRPKKQKESHAILSAPFWTVVRKTISPEKG